MLTVAKQGYWRTCVQLLCTQYAEKILMLQLVVANVTWNTEVILKF